MLKINEIRLINLLRNIFISIFTLYINIKFLDFKNINLKRTIYLIISIIFINCAWLYVEKYFTSVSGIFYANITIAMICSQVLNIKIGYSILITTISLSINYILYLFAVMICFFVYKLFKINDYITFSLIILIYFFIIKTIFNTTRLRKGIIFLKKYQKNDYFDILILNMSSIVFLAFITLVNFDNDLRKVLLVFIVTYSIIMFITIQKSLQLYYKQKMLVKDLEETKAELEEKNTRIKELENEIIKSGKKSHSISHRQDILEHKLEELNMKSEISEMDIKSRIEKVGKDIRKEPVIVLAKTGIAEIDDVLDYMKSECVKKKIDFQLQLSGNIYKMINNYVSKDELEILLADHIKNAIIAIEYSNNINKSILVRLGRLDGTYGLYVYDSGIEFEKETLLKLGKKPATTHKDSGGTGMGFMNTFDTLRKHNASFIIEEYGKPVTDNFTKVLKFKFDGKKEFKICTYRKEEIEKQDKEKTLVVEKLIF